MVYSEWCVMYDVFVIDTLCWDAKMNDHTTADLLLFFKKTWNLCQPELLTLPWGRGAGAVRSHSMIVCCHARAGRFTLPKNGHGHFYIHEVNFKKSAMSSTLNHSTMAPNVPMDRDERIRRFGIECIGPAGDGIFFRAGTWRPGGEYIQKLIIRNVSTSVKKLKYKLPSTRYFSMAYPDPIVLSPGLSQEVDVVFRPVEYEPYDDTIYIKMLDGISGNGFHVPVRATIDKLSLAAPDGLDLGYCTTHQTSYLTFLLKNDGEIDAPYAWQVPAPFIFTPSSGVVPVGQAHEITISLMPTDASVYVSKAVCVVGQGVHAIIPNPYITTKLSAIAKFPYITLSDAEVSFDEVVSGMAPDKKEVVLYNNRYVYGVWAPYGVCTCVCMVHMHNNQCI